MKEDFNGKEEANDEVVYLHPNLIKISRGW